MFFTHINFSSLSTVHILRYVDNKKQLHWRWHFTSYSNEYTMIWYNHHQPMIRSEILGTSPFHVCCVFGDRNFSALKISDCFQMDLKRNWANPNDKLKMIASSIEQHVKCNKINSKFEHFWVMTFLSRPVDLGMALVWENLSVQHFGTSDKHFSNWTRLTN